MRAAGAGKLDLVTFLVEHGADLKAKSKVLNRKEKLADYK